MTHSSSLRKALTRSGIYTLLLTLFFIIAGWDHQPANEIWIALPFFVIFYFLLFSIGRPEVSGRLQFYGRGDATRLFLFPLILVILYFSYLGLGKQDPFKGTVFLVPFLLFFPVLAFAGRKDANETPGWFDFAVFFIFFFPVTLVKIVSKGELPFSGESFDSIYRISVMLVAVFAFVTVRNIRDVGFYPVFSWKKLLTVLWVWILFYVFVFIIGYLVHFIRLKDESTIHIYLNSKVAWSILLVFLHAGLFEELVFRGLLLNMLAKRIDAGGSWKIFLAWGAAILFAFSLIIGYSLKGSMQWFPGLITVCICSAAFLIGQKYKDLSGNYAALALSSVLFGLVHAHTGSVIFVGLAAIGGWAYGYVYLKTRSVFYSALLHAIVNSTALIFGLALAK